MWHTTFIKMNNVFKKNKFWIEIINSDSAKLRISVKKLIFENFL